MSYFLDTSAFVKLFANEQGTSLVREVASDGRPLVVSAVTRVEAHAAFARMTLTRRIAEQQASDLWSAIDRALEAMVVIGVDADVFNLATDLTHKHCLRGYDAVQLACALHSKLSGLTFVCFDRELSVAAKSEGLSCIAADF